MVSDTNFTNNVIPCSQCECSGFLGSSFVSLVNKPTWDMNSKITALFLKAYESVWYVFRLSTDI